MESAVVPSCTRLDHASAQLAAARGAVQQRRFGSDREIGPSSSGVPLVLLTGYIAATVNMSH